MNDTRFNQSGVFMIKTFSVFIFCSVLFVGSVHAQVQEAEFESEGAANEMSLDHGDFLGCFSSRHECRHEGQHHGYHHVIAVHDHETCHHDPYSTYACYGVE